MRRGSGMEVSLIKPTSLDDAKEICDYLLAGKAVVLNIGGNPHRDRTADHRFHIRIHIFHERKSPEDFNYIFIATPDSVELSGDFQDILSAGVSSGVDMSSLNIHL